VSQAEHLLRLVSEAQEARDPAARERLSRELRGAVRALRAAAESFSEQGVATYLDSVSEAVAELEPVTLSALRNVAVLLADPSARSDRFGEEIARLTSSGAGPTRAAAPPTAAPPAPAPRQRVPQAAPPRVPANGMRARTPTGRDLAAILDAGISGLGQQLSQRPLSQPVPIVDEVLVPIEMLFYRGRAALDRALELRNQMRGAGRGPSGDELAELYDLLDLATTE
jgi:hypothetical protein